MEKYQVIIVGAGPSGAACAKALTQAGVRTLIIEKELLPRYKTCSGVLFGQTQELLRQLFGTLPPDHVFCEPRIIPASQILEWRGGQDFIPYSWEIPKDGHQFTQNYLNVKRDQFDYWLIRQSGAQVRQKCVFRGYATEQDGIRVDVFLRDEKILEPGGTGNPNISFHCDYLVAADGSASSVRRALRPDQWASVPEVIYYQEYCPIIDMGTLSDGCWYVFFEKTVADMLCCIHRKDNRLVPCVGSFRGGNLQTCMARFKDFIRENFKVSLGNAQRVEGVVIKMWQPDLGSGRVLLTGQAGGFIYLNDEGISAALDSGYRCGTAIARALREAGDALEYYRQSTQDILDHVRVCADQSRFMVE